VRGRNEHSKPVTADNCGGMSGNGLMVYRVQFVACSNCSATVERQRRRPLADFIAPVLQEHRLITTFPALYQTDIRFASWQVVNATCRSPFVVEFTTSFRTRAADATPISVLANAPNMSEKASVFVSDFLVCFSFTSFA
jgi:hypothetical protein